MTATRSEKTFGKLDEVRIDRMWVDWQPNGFSGLEVDAIHAAAVRASWDEEPQEGESEEAQERRLSDTYLREYIEGKFHLVIPILRVQVVVASNSFGCRTIQFESGISLMPCIDDDTEDLTRKLGAAIQDIEEQLQAFGILGPGETLGTDRSFRYVEEKVEVTLEAALRGAVDADRVYATLAARMTDREKHDHLSLSQAEGRARVKAILERGE